MADAGTTIDDNPINADDTAAANVCAYLYHQVYYFGLPRDIQAAAREQIDSGETTSVNAGNAGQSQSSYHVFSQATLTSF